MSFLDDWLKNLILPAHSTEWINGVTGAGGAVLGSLVTIVWTAWYNDGTRNRERREKFAAGAFAAYQRLNQIYSVSLVIRDHLDAGYAMAASRSQPNCTATMPMQRMSGPVLFPIEELWTLTQVGGSDLINRVNSLDQAFNQLLDVIDRYGVARQEVWSKFPTPDSMDGVVGSVGFTQEEYKKIAPDIAALDHILAQVMPISRGIVSDTYAALLLLVHAKTKPLGKKFKVFLPNPGGEMVEISAQDNSKLSWWNWRR